MVPGWTSSMPTGRCPVCGRPVAQTLRYPRALCAECVGRATDLAERPIRFADVPGGGGFVARHAEDWTVCDQVIGDGRVLIDGREFAASEARAGGWVVQPPD
jgi:hypothetical protein